MSTRMTMNGVSTCQTAGTEKYESFQLGYGRKTFLLRETDIRRVPSRKGQVAYG